MKLLLLLSVTLILSLGTINYHSLDASGCEFQGPSSEPKDCSINFDYMSEYPPYFQLYITNIIGQNNNLFPDNLLIAIKADEGRLIGGQSVNGWSVYSTTGARIPEKIKYIPPKCEISKTDILSFAAVYKTQDGTIDIRTVSFTKKIINPMCLGAEPIALPEDTLGPEKPEEPEEPEDKPGNSAWTGTIHLEITERFNCNVDEKTGQLSRQEVTAADEKRAVANMSVGMDDFDLPTQSSNAGGKLRYISGDLMIRLLEDHNYKGSADKSQCHIDHTGKWEWVSPGSWFTRHETMSGQAFRDIKAENLTMLIVKDIGYNKSKEQEMQNQTQEAARMMEIQRQLAEAGKNVDRKAIEEMKNQMVKMVQGDKNSSTFPVIIRVQLGFGGKPDRVSTTYDYVEYNVCLAKEDNESRSNTLDYPLVTVMAAEFKGTYTKGDNGQDKITARVDSTETRQGSFYSDICPEKVIITSGKITLERHKD